MECEYYWISKTQNVSRLRGQQYLIHFPLNYRRALCGRLHDWRKLSHKMAEESWQKMIICEDCLTHSGEY